MHIAIAATILLTLAAPTSARQVCMLFPYAIKPPGTNFLVDRQTTYRCVCHVDVGRLLPGGLCERKDER